MISKVKIKKIVLENFEKHCSIDHLFYLRNATIIDKVIDDICDISLDTIPGIDQDSTYLLRKRLGILDNGRKQKISDVSKETGRSGTRISLIVNKAYIKLGNEIRMMSVDNKSSKELAKTSVSDLRTNYSNCLHRNCIHTVEELMEYKKDDLINLHGLGNIGAEEIINTVHKLGLYFSDEKRTVMDDKPKKVTTMEQHILLDEYNKLLQEKKKIENQMMYVENKILSLSKKK